MKRLGSLLACAALLLGACSDDTGDQNMVSASESEIAFLQQMWAHHAQAVQLGLHTARNGADEAVRALALDIAVAQAHEQGEIEGLLLDRDASPDPPADHEAMAGMIAPDDLAAALASSGSELDAVFVELMLDHHRGAVTAAGEAREREELSEPVQDLAGRIVSSQQREITELELLRG